MRPVRSSRLDPDQLPHDSAVADFLAPRWPVIGPPQLLQWYQTRDGFMNSRDGCVVAMANYDGGLIFMPIIPIVPDASCLITMYVIALSPMAAGSRSHVRSETELSKSGTLRRSQCPDIPPHLEQQGRSSAPDGRWLGVLCKGDQGWELIETRTWTSRIRLGNRQGPAAFSPDSAIFAHETHFKSYDGSIALVELATSANWAADQWTRRCAFSYRIEFSPDGTQLIGVLSDQPYVRSGSGRYDSDLLSSI